MDGAAFFERGRRAGLRLCALRREIGAVKDAVGSGRPLGGGSKGPHGRGGISNPTLSAAMASDGLEARLADMERERSGLEAAVSVLADVIAGMRLALGDAYADVMADWYLLGPERCYAGPGLTWQDVADERGISLRTAMRRRSVAIDWLEDVGLTGAIEGRFTKGE